MNIYLLRHGETEYTKIKRIQGKSQVPLNEEGLNMAENAANTIKKFRVSHIYCSNLKRAIQTAEKVNSEWNLPINYDSRINERDYGLWEHKLWSDVFEENPTLNKTWEEEGTEFRPPKGESLNEVISRTLDFFKEIISKHKAEDDILIVCHGGPLKVILGYVKGLNKSDYYKQNFLNPCELVAIKYNGGFQIG